MALNLGGDHRRKNILEASSIGSFFHRRNGLNEMPSTQPSTRKNIDRRVYTYRLTGSMLSYNTFMLIQ